MGEVKLNKYEVICPIANYGFLVKRWEEIETINYEGKPASFFYDKYNILTNKKAILLDNWVDDITFKMNNSFCVFGINNGDKYGVFDIKGNLVIKPIYDKLYYDSDDIFLASANNKFGFVTSKGQLTPIIFNNAGFFYEDLAAVNYNYRWGFVNKYTILDNPEDYDQYSIAPKYQKVDDFENGICRVKYDNKYIYIDKNDNPIEQKIKTKH